MDVTTQKIVLASASPRRKELLGMLFEKFEIITADCDENIIEQTPEETVVQLSEKKAMAVAGSAQIREKALVLGADTVVSLDGKILGKPKNRGDAYHMIKMLSGKTHKVCTGVTIVHTDADGMPASAAGFVETTQVRVAELTEEEIQAYIDTEEPYDKAGGYGIQGIFGKYIEGIEGDYYNVVGLPVHRLYAELKK